jgi:hypothetical protein
MAVTCNNCQLAPVVCQISKSVLETVYCYSCLEALVRASIRVYEQKVLDSGDLELLGATERLLKKLRDSGEWKPNED